MEQMITWSSQSSLVKRDPSLRSWAVDYCWLTSDIWTMKLESSKEWPLAALLCSWESWWTVFCGEERIVLQNSGRQENFSPHHWREHRQLWYLKNDSRADNQTKSPSSRVNYFKIQTLLTMQTSNAKRQEKYKIPALAIGCSLEMVNYRRSIHRSSSFKSLATKMHL